MFGDEQSEAGAVIRYVTAVILATALLGAGLAALEEGAAIRGEAEVEGAVSTVEDEAASLVANDDLALGGGEPPRRVVDIDLPDGDRTSAPVDSLVFEPVEGANVTVVRYRVDGQDENRLVVDAPLTNAEKGGDRVDLSEIRGEQTLVLELVADDDQQPVVQVSPYRF